MPSEIESVKASSTWLAGRVGPSTRTLGNIRRRPDFASGAEIKVSRRCVANTILLTKLAGGNDLLLRGLFRLSSRGLPLPATRG